MVFEYVPDDGSPRINLVDIVYGIYYGSTEYKFKKPPQRRDWYADYLEEQKPPQVEIETDLGFARTSWFEDGRFKVRRVPIVHG